MAQFDFRGTAISETSLSPLMDGKERISMDGLISTYPNGVTVTEFDLLSGQQGEYAVCTFAEDSSKFFFGGAILTKIVLKWIAGFDGDCELASHTLKDNGGVKMRFKHGRTKKGQQLTLVEIL